MSAVSQTIQNFTGGISEQPDYLKVPGQVKDAVNVVPDLTYGLHKRLGARRLTENPLPNLSSDNSKWFHYYRSAEEGSFIGQIDSTGAVNIYRLNTSTTGGTTYNAGTQVPTAWGTGGETAIKNYLKHQSSYDSTAQQQNHVKTMTINDTTFVSQEGVHADLTDATAPGKLHSYYAYIELKKTENGRQYGLDISKENSTDRNYWTATRLKVVATNRPGVGTDGQGHCPHVGTRIFKGPDEQWGGINANLNGRNLLFRLTVTGQQTPSNDAENMDDMSDFSCTYDHKIDLLHGGQGWIDAYNATTFSITNLPTKFRGNDNTQTADDGFMLMGAKYEAVIEDSERYTAKVVSTGTETDACDAGFIRPMPTPFDAETGVSAGSILGGMKEQIDKKVGINCTNGGEISSNAHRINCEIVGNGLYLYSDNKFSVRVIEPDLMRVVTSETNDVSNLPLQCKHGYMLMISNSQNSNEDDYWLKFNGNHSLDGPGKWTEVAYPGIRYNPDASELPHTIQRTTANQFTVSQFTYTDRLVGDNITNPKPYFVTAANHLPAERRVHRVLYWRNRLVIATDTKLSLSQPNDLANFWRQTALATGPNDAILIKSSQSYPGNLMQGIEVAAGLVLFSENQQLLLTTDSETLTPESARLLPLSNYYNNKQIAPISLGTTLGFIDNSGRNARFMEMAQITGTTDPVVFEHSKVIPTSMPKDVDLLDVSRDNGMVFIGKTGTDTIYVYRWYAVGQQRLLSSWVKWKFTKSIKYFCVSDDTLYVLDDNNFLQAVNLIASDEDITVDETVDGDTIKWDTHLDNYYSQSGGTYSETTNKTTFSASWLSSATGVTAQLVIVDNKGRYATCTVNGTSFTVDGDWTKDITGAAYASGARHVGYLYDMEVEFPKVYPTKTVGQKTVADVNGSLVLHRLKIGFGRIGTYKFNLARTGKDDYIEEYEATVADTIDANEPPYLQEAVKTIPVYDKNTNVVFTLKSTHPSPATLHSLSWEGDYTPKNYRR